MARDIRDSGAACAAVQRQLPALLSAQLDGARAVEVRLHVVQCERCSARLADLVADEVSRGLLSLTPPAFVPPTEVYEAFLRSRKTRFGTLWKLVRDGLEATDEAIRRWARFRREAISETLASLLAARSAAPAESRGQPAVRVRGAVRTRGAVRARGARPDRRRLSLNAEVVRSDSTPAGGSVPFDLVEPPRVTEEGAFRVRLLTQSAGCAGQVALCTIELESGARVSFTGPIRRLPGTDTFGVEIHETGVSAVAGEIPLDRVSLFVTQA